MRRIISALALALACASFIQIVRAADPLDAPLAELPKIKEEMLKYEKDIKERVKTGTNFDDAVKALKKEEANQQRSYGEHERIQGLIDAAAKNVKNESEGIINTAAKNMKRIGAPRGPLGAVHLRRSFDGDGLERAAAFSYQHTPAADVFSVDAAVIFDAYLFEGRKLDTELQFSTDLKLSSDAKKSPNRIKTRATTALLPENLALPRIGLTDWIAYASAVHETDRDFRTQNMLAEFLLRPEFKWGCLRLNAQTNLAVGELLLGRYEIGPLLGFEGGTTVRDSKGISPEHGGFLRPLARVTISFTPNILDGKLILHFNDTMRFLSADKYRSRNLLGAGAEYEITKNISLTLEYSQGYDAPKFEKEDVVKLGLGVKF